MSKEDQLIAAGRSAVAAGNSDDETDANIGDIVGFNSARVALNRLIIEPTLTEPATAPVTAECVLQNLTLSVFSTAQNQYIDVNVSLTEDLIEVFLDGSDTPLPPSSITVDAQGYIHIPCLQRDSWGAQLKKARIEIPITSQMFDEVILGSPPPEEPTGESFSDVELGPDYYEEVVDSKIFLPIVRK